MGPDFTFFVVYGSVHHLVDLRQVEVVEREFPLLSPKEVNSAIKSRLRRKLVVVGACIGTDAHTVGIDAILNIKGFAGEKGWSTTARSRSSTSAPRCSCRSSSPGPAPRRPTRSWSARWSQKDAHVHNTTTMSAAFREAYPAGKVPLLVVGGPRFEEGSAHRLGVDRIFGRAATTPGEVASYLVHALATSKEVHP